jgi:hypothetical protein
MKRTTPFALGIIAMFALAQLAAAQTTKEEAARELSSDEEAGSRVEFGFRTFWGDVYGRPDLLFTPALKTSKLNEYGDIRRNFVVPRATLNLDDVLGTRNYFKYQTQSSFYNDQSHLGSFGQYGKYKVQFRYNEIPHVFSNTTRNFYAETQRGVLTLPLTIRQALQTASSTGTAAQINNTLPSTAAQLISSGQLFVPRLQRKAGMGIFSYYLTPDWTVDASYTREHEAGTRPLGAILNSSPSASGSAQPGTTNNRQSPGTGVELPELIDYTNNTARATTEYGRRNWAVQLGYLGSFFQTNTPSMLFDAPFATADIPVQLIPPGSGCTPTPPAVNCSIAATPAHGQMSTYPDNKANYLNFAGAFDAGKHVRVMGSTVAGWLRQNDPFLPYSANTAITGLAPLPARSLNGNKQTLAMNWTAVGRLTRDFQLEAKYRHYDYNNNTKVFELTPVEGDVIGANSTATDQGVPGVVDTSGRSNPGYNRRTLEFSGNYLFGKRSSAKLGWEGDWFDRSYRDVAHSMENSIFGAVDYSPTPDLMFRIAGRHQSREPEVYQDATAVDPVTEAAIPCISTSAVFTEEQRCHRRFDESARILNRADVMLEYNLRQFTFGGTFQTIQSDFNRRGGTNSPTALNFLPGTTRPYYLYGFMNDLSWIYSFDATYAFSPAASLFAEYTRENYYKRMISRNRTPPSGTATILTCSGCDSPNNDWESTTRDVFDTYALGFDFFLAKRFWFSPYYSLAGGIGNVFSRALGDPTITTGPNQFVLTGSTTPESYPQTATRIHEVTAAFKFKLSANLTPKLEYRYQQFDNRDYQTTAMTPYMGCIGAGSIVVSPPCVNVGPNLAVQYPRSSYPGFVVGDTAAARYLFLGADQPSYRAHIITATLEYRF